MPSLLPASFSDLPANMLHRGGPFGGFPGGGGGGAGAGGGGGGGGDPFGRRRPSRGRQGYPPPPFAARRVPDSEYGPGGAPPYGGDPARAALAYAAASYPDAGPHMDRPPGLPPRGGHPGDPHHLAGGPDGLAGRFAAMGMTDQGAVPPGDIANGRPTGRGAMGGGGGADMGDGDGGGGGRREGDGLDGGGAGGGGLSGPPGGPQHMGGPDSHGGSGVAGARPGGGPRFLQQQAYPNNNNDGNAYTAGGGRPDGMGGAGERIGSGGGGGRGGRMEGVLGGGRRRQEAGLGGPQPFGGRPYGPGMGMMPPGMHQGRYDPATDYYMPNDQDLGHHGQYVGEMEDPFNPPRRRHQFLERSDRYGQPYPAGEGGFYGRHHPSHHDRHSRFPDMADRYEQADHFGPSRMHFDEGLPPSYGAGGVDGGGRAVGAYTGQFGGGRSGHMDERFGGATRAGPGGDRDRYQDPGGYGQYAHRPSMGPDSHPPGMSSFVPGHNPSTFGPLRGDYGRSGYGERPFGNGRYGDYGPGGPGRGGGHGRGGYGPNLSGGVAGASGPGVGRLMTGSGGGPDSGMYGRRGAGRSSFYGPHGRDQYDGFEPGDGGDPFGYGQRHAPGFRRGYDQRQPYADHYEPSRSRLPDEFPVPDEFPGRQQPPNAYPNMMGPAQPTRSSRNERHADLVAEDKREIIRLIRRFERYSGTGRSRSRPNPERAELAGFLAGKLLNAAGIAPEFEDGKYAGFLDMFVNGQAKYGNGDEELSRFRAMESRRRASPRFQAPRERPEYGDNSSISTSSGSE